MPYAQRCSPMRGHNRLTRVMQRHADDPCTPSTHALDWPPHAYVSMCQSYSRKHAPKRWRCPSAGPIGPRAPPRCVHAPSRTSALPSRCLAQHRPYCRQHRRPHARVPWRPWPQPPPTFPHLRHLHRCPRVLPQPGHHPLHVLPVRPSSGPAVLGAVGEVAGGGATQMYKLAQEVFTVH